jgi:hypothetical protein
MAAARQSPPQLSGGDGINQDVDGGTTEGRYFLSRRKPPVPSRRQLSNHWLHPLVPSLGPKREEPSQSKGL